MDSLYVSDRIDQWFTPNQREPLVEHLSHQVGLTRTRASYFLKLWVYLLAKQCIAQNDTEQDERDCLPLQQLEPLRSPVSCSHREAARLFYSGRDEGSDRAAGMMLDKLAALGLIAKHFDGNTTRIDITLPASKLYPQPPETLATLILDDFDPRCDAVPVANLLALNYGWMNQSMGRKLDIVPHRITRLLRCWASEYPTGMRVLRQADTLNPVGFYLLYPVAPDSEINFSSSPAKGLHLASASDTDPFTLAAPKDPDCTAVFIRSWMIAPEYLERDRARFLTDAQETLRKMQRDFPNLCDLYTLIIHPSYEAMAIALNFQKIGIAATHSRDTQIYWMYQALDRYIQLDIKTIFPA